MKIELAKADYAAGHYVCRAAGEITCEDRALVRFFRLYWIIG